jgi:hypothetical protein
MHARESTDMAMQTWQACPTKANLHHCPIPANGARVVLQNLAVRHKHKKLPAGHILRMSDDAPSQIHCWVWWL